ncbi:collagen alpha-2(XI) chain-like [Salmo trutta]|uniref:collagen alpha-2(XI) chain-like n=1 Tax=Salmo trutta TaxID=8032 RepID=UPI001131EBAE|nr:collagen alpha-2(XI) chain-like [Salmo trutta]
MDLQEEVRTYRERSKDLQEEDPQNLQPYDAQLGRGQAPWTPPLGTDPVQAPKAWAPECSHAHWPSLSSSLTPVLQPLPSPPPRDTELDLEARTSRLLRLTSDLSDDSTVLRRFSEGASRCQSPAPRSVSLDRLMDHQSPRLQPASRIQHGGSPQRQRMEQGCLAALTPPGPVDYTGQAAGSGLYSPSGPVDYTGQAAGSGLYSPSGPVDYTGQAAGPGLYSPSGPVDYTGQAAGSGLYSPSGPVDYTRQAAGPGPYSPSGPVDYTGQAAGSGLYSPSGPVDYTGQAAGPGPYSPSGPVDYTGQAAGSGLYSDLYSPPPPGSDLQTGTRSNSISATQGSRLGFSDCHSVPRTLSPQPGVAELSSCLRGLLNLVDQHWAGTRSLHLNPDFLGQAYDLLSALGSPPATSCLLSPPGQAYDLLSALGSPPATSCLLSPPGQAYDLLSALGSPPATSCLKETEEKRERQNRGGQSESHVDVTPQCSEVVLLKRKLTVTQQQLDSLKKRLVEALKVNYNLKLTSLKQDSSNTAETYCGRHWDRCLQRQVIALREQETHLRQLEQTIVLLQGNHRSLESNNNSLLGHLIEHITIQSPENPASSLI